MKGLTIALIALNLTACGFEQVDTGHRGVQIRYGKVDEQIGSMSEGLYFYNPMTSNIIEMDVRTQKWEGHANTYTRDVQQANIKFVVNYRLKPDVAHLVFKNVGYNWADVLLPQAIEGDLKKIVGNYEAVELIDHRSEATRKVLEAAKLSLGDKGVVVERIELVNIDYTEVFEHSVEEKVVAIQKAVEEKNRTKQVREQARQQVISAQAQAESMRIRANALSQNAKLVEYEAVQKWDGKLPQYQMGGAVPFINVGGK